MTLRLVRAVFALSLVTTAGLACEVEPGTTDGVALEAGQSQQQLSHKAGEPRQSEAVEPPIEETSLDVLDALNAVREALELDPLATEPALEAAATSHADYLLSNHDDYVATGHSAHTQEPSFEGFSGVTFVDRTVVFGYDGVGYGEVVAFKPSGVGAVTSWLESLYHRLPLISPRPTEAGYGQATGDDVTVNVLELGYRTDAAPAGGVVTVVFPADGAVDVPTAWDGQEVPQPPEPPAGYPSGPVVTLQVWGAAIDGVEATLTPADSDAPLAAVTLTAAGDPLLGAGEVALIPHSPLAPLTTYRVQMRGEAGGEPFAHAWTFTTRRDGCGLVDQDCGPGRGCYVIQGEATCLWAGVTGEDEPCRFANDCRAGLSCYGSRCHPVCDARPGAPADSACAVTCPSVAAPLDDDDHAACLAASCVGEGAGCGAGEGCYFTQSAGFFCHWAGPAQAGEACTYVNDCAPGLGCLAIGGELACHRFCDAPGMAACSDVCPGPSAPLPDEPSGTAVCL